MPETLLIVAIVCFCASILILFVVLLDSCVALPIRRSRKAEVKPQPPNPKPPLPHAHTVSIAPSIRSQTNISYIDSTVVAIDGHAPTLSPEFKSQRISYFDNTSSDISSYSKPLHSPISGKSLAVPFPQDRVLQKIPAITPQKIAIPLPAATTQYNTPQSQRTRNVSVTMTEILGHYIPNDKNPAEVAMEGTPISVISATAVKRKSAFRPDRVTSPPSAAPSSKKSSEFVDKSGIVKEVMEYNTVEEYVGGGGTSVVMDGSLVASCVGVSARDDETSISLLSSVQNGPNAGSKKALRPGSWYSAVSVVESEVLEEQARMMLERQQGK
ncbi:UNVERIFIED_CONTAM: hypothetical protein HDU68_001103 [Siphonaria sp. JEL0065]|nr:hypothetical protein HDU68_001103 [Siphonaria sp. JEL0065]